MQYMATISRLLKMIGLFCKRALSKRWYSMKDAHLTCKWRLLHMWMKITTHVNEDYYTCEGNHTTYMKGVMSHMWKSHITHMQKSCHIYEGVLLHIWMCSMTPSYVRHDLCTGWRRFKDPLSCRSFSTKDPLDLGHFCGKWRIKTRDPMSLRHPVARLLHMSV